MNESLKAPAEQPQTRQQMQPETAAPRVLTGTAPLPAAREHLRVVQEGSDHSEGLPQGMGWGDALSPSFAPLHSLADQLSHLTSMKTPKFKTKAYIKKARRNQSDSSTRSLLLSR